MRVRYRIGDPGRSSRSTEGFTAETQRLRRGLALCGERLIRAMGSANVREMRGKPSLRFSADVLEKLEKGRMVRIRAGTGHRDIGIWVVVVEGRVFARSWSLSPRSWYRTFLEDPHGAIRIGGEEIPIRAVRTRSERLKAAVDRAYAAKYTTPASLQYVKGFRVKRRRDTTTELVPER